MPGDKVEVDERFFDRYPGLEVIGGTVAHELQRLTVVAYGLFVGVGRLCKVCRIKTVAFYAPVVVCH